MNKDSNKKYSENVVRKSIELILLGESIKNKSINKVINTTDQQSIDIGIIRNRLYSSTLNFEEIYKQLSAFEPEIIPIIIATIIKDNIDFIVIEKSGEEQPITYKTIMDIHSNPGLYTLTYIKDQENFYKYKSDFDFKDSSTNIFCNIVDAMQYWFFSLNKYTAIINKEYVGKGKYKKLSDSIINFKSSLKGIQSNPFFYLDKKLPEIFKRDTVNQLKNAKNYIDDTVKRLKKALDNDINFIFPETVESWYASLPDDIKNRIFNNGEERFLLLCKNRDNNFIENIAKYLTGLPIEVWEEDTPTCFYNRLIKIKNLIENNINKEINNGFIIQSINKNSKSFKILELPEEMNTDIEKIMVNDLKALFDDYGNTLCHGEKVALALKVALEGAD